MRVISDTLLLLGINDSAELMPEDHELNRSSNHCRFAQG